MTKTSVIEHSPRQQLVVIREDYLSICDGDHCRAALLNIFEYWTNVKMGQIEQTTIENEIAAKGGVAPKETDIWVYKTIPDLQTELLSLFGQKSIGVALQWLKDKGFLATRNNPKFGWDRTTQYEFQIDAVTSALLHDASGNFARSKGQKDILHDVKRGQQYHKTTSKTTPLDSKDASGDAVTVATLIKAWLDASQIIAPNAYSNKTIRTKAQVMIDLGIQPIHITDCIQSMRKDKFWAGKGVSFESLAKDIQPWLNSNRAGWNKKPSTTPDPKPSNANGSSSLTDFGKK